VTLDAHQHFWHPQRGDYDWMPKDNATLHRAYTPADLAPLLARSGVVGTVLVQAAASVEETEYMLGLADATDSVKGVVGWIDFERPAHLEQLRRLSGHPKFLGVRPMIQDIPDDNWMLRDDIQWAYEAIVELDLTFDALGFVRHIPNFLTVAKRYPEMRIVFDHCLKPQIRDQMRGEDVAAG
jgi:L-fuconolactonase